MKRIIAFALLLVACEIAEEPVAKYEPLVFLPILGDQEAECSRTDIDMICSSEHQLQLAAPANGIVVARSDSSLNIITTDGFQLITHKVTEFFPEIQSGMVIDQGDVIGLQDPGQPLGFRVLTGQGQAVNFEIAENLRPDTVIFQGSHQNLGSELIAELMQADECTWGFRVFHNELFLANIEADLEIVYALRGGDDEAEVPTQYRRVVELNKSHLYQLEPYIPSSAPTICADSARFELFE